MKSVISNLDKQWGPERQRFCVKSNTGPPIGEDSEQLQKFLKADRVLCFKDLGLQLSWRLVYMIEYIGPLLFVPLFYYFQLQIYGTESKKTQAQQ